MSGYAVLGPPDSGIDVRYRGLDRDVPFVQERLGLSHHANKTLLKVLEDHEIPGLIPDLEVARTLASAFRSVPGLGPYEVVEIRQPGQQPEASGNLLGYDVTFKEGPTSLLAWALLWNDQRINRDAKAAAQIAALRHRFVDRLNDSLLFDTPSDAAAFLNAATEFGPWEPGADWEVKGVWEVNQE